MPVISAMVPPEKPGTTSTAPMAMPLTYSRSVFFIDPSLAAATDERSKRSRETLASSYRPVQQRYEAHRVQYLAGEAMFLADDQHQLLGIPAADRYHQPATRRQLVKQGLGHFRRGGSDDDAVVGRQCRPAFPAVAPAKHHVAQGELGQTLLGPVLQYLDAFHRDHPLDQLRQHGGLVTRAGADLQHLVERPAGEQQLGHAADHVRLRDGLVVADRQRGVLVGTVRQRLVDEQMARRPPDHFEYAGVGQPFLVETLDQPLARALRGHADAVTVQILFEVHHSNPASQLSRLGIASWKLRSSCSGVTDT